MDADRDGLLRALRAIVEGMRAAFAEGDMVANKKLDTEWHWAFVKHANNRYLTESYGGISLLVEALRYRFMDSATYRNQAFEEHQQMLDLLTANNLTKAIEMLRAHIERTERYQSTITWSEGRAPRRKYQLRDYAAVLGGKTGRNSTSV
jgi:DNA-binding GntR family transcriptional regulator